MTPRLLAVRGTVRLQRPLGMGLWEHRRPSRQSRPSFCRSAQSRAGVGGALGALHRPTDPQQAPPGQGGRVTIIDRRAIRRKTAPRMPAARAARTVGRSGHQTASVMVSEEVAVWPSPVEAGYGPRRLVTAPTRLLGHASSGEVLVRSVLWGAFAYAYALRWRVLADEGDGGALAPRAAVGATRPQSRPCPSSAGPLRRRERLGPRGLPTRSRSSPCTPRSASCARTRRSHQPPATSPTRRQGRSAVSRDQDPEGNVSLGSPQQVQLEADVNCGRGVSELPHRDEFDSGGGDVGDGIEAHAA